MEAEPDSGVDDLSLDVVNRVEVLRGREDGAPALTARNSDVKVLRVQRRRECVAEARR